MRRWRGGCKWRGVQVAGGARAAAADPKRHMDPPDSPFGLLLEADQLKAVLRQSTLLDVSRHENSAEHSWHLALMALVLQGHAPAGTDIGRVIVMVLLHDLVEIDAGDLFVYAGEEAQA